MVTGNLTLHGVTRQMVLPVAVLGVGVHPRTKAPVAGFEAEVTEIDLGPACSDTFDTAFLYPSAFDPLRH